jgi:hypothetical protein
VSSCEQLPEFQRTVLSSSSVEEGINVFPTTRNYLHNGTVLYIRINGVDVGQEVNS